MIFICRRERRTLRGLFIESSPTLEGDTMKELRRKLVFGYGADEWSSSVKQVRMMS